MIRTLGANGGMGSRPTPAGLAGPNPFEKNIRWSRRVGAAGRHGRATRGPCELLAYPYPMAHGIFPLTADEPVGLSQSEETPLAPWTGG